MSSLDPIPDDFIVVTPNNEQDEKKAYTLQKFLTWFIRKQQEASKGN